MAKIRFPKKVEIGGAEVDVFYPYVFEDNDGLGGSFSPAEMRIYIMNKDVVDNQTLVHTFIHECVHAVDYIYLSVSLSEDQVDSIARGLLQVFRFNDLDLCNIDLDDVPEEIIVGGQRYKIIFPYAFYDVGFERTVTCCQLDLHEIRITNVLNNRPISKYSLQAGILYGILHAIENEFHGNTEEEISQKNKITLTNGIYQLLKNTKLEERIKKWIEN